MDALQGSSENESGCLQNAATRTVEEENEPREEREAEERTKEERARARKRKRKRKMHTEPKSHKGYRETKLCRRGNRQRKRKKWKRKKQHGGNKRETRNNDTKAQRQNTDGQATRHAATEPTEMAGGRTTRTAPCGTHTVHEGSCREILRKRTVSKWRLLRSGGGLWRSG